MTPLQALKQAVHALEELDCDYCLIGGHAASLYRTRERLTKDVDFALVAKEQGQSRKIAETCIKKLGLRPVVGFIPKGENSVKRKSIRMVTSAPHKNELTGIIDILLPEVPWVTNAVVRAQHNKIDLGFHLVPVITPEDLIIAKCYAVHNSPDRFQDLDDLKELFLGANELDLDYVRPGLLELAVSVPKAVKKFSSL